MSHYSVAVFSKTPDEVDALLAPFNEDVDAGSEYAEFVQDEECDMDHIAGKCGYWHNPDGKWDYHELAGRFRGQLKLKAGCTGVRAPWDPLDTPRTIPSDHCDQARVADCDFSVDAQMHQKGMRFWEVVVEGSPLRENESASDFRTRFSPEFYIRRYETKERYAYTNARFAPHSFLTADGEWYEQGRMLFFGADEATTGTIDAFFDELDEYIQTAMEEGLYITMVDCHT